MPCMALPSSWAWRLLPVDSTAYVSHGDIAHDSDRTGLFVHFDFSTAHADFPEDRGTAEMPLGLDGAPDAGANDFTPRIAKVLRDGLSKSQTLLARP